jgi:sulfur-oxidizing protein SoxX
MWPLLSKIAGRLLGLSTVSAVLLAAASIDAAAQAVCATKTAGYFKLFQHDARVPLTQGIVKPLTSAPGDASRGQAFVTDPEKGNCLVCHQFPGTARGETSPTLGPPLNGAGSRYTEAVLRQVIVDPSVVFPRTVMPAYFKLAGLTRVAAGHNGKTILSPQEIEDIVAYLKVQK